MRFNASIVALACAWSGLAGTPAEVDVPPSLPEVDTLLEEAYDTVSLFRTQATDVQELVSAQHQASREGYESQKRQLELELAKIEQNCSDMVVFNDKLRTGITQLHAGNEHLLQHATRMQRGSNLMRDALNSLVAKMTVARTFITDSLNRTNLKGHSALKVLDPMIPEPTLEHFLSVAKGSLEVTNSTVMQGPVGDLQTDLERLSLLEVSSGGLKLKRMKRAQPSSEGSTAEDLVQTLSSSISQLDAAQEQGTTALKAHYIALAEVSEKRYGALVAEQQDLNRTRADLVTLQEQLHAARAYLTNTSEDLRNRLSGLRVFAQSANKTSAEAIRQARLKHRANITSVSAASFLATMEGMSFKRPSVVSAASHTDF